MSHPYGFLSYRYDVVRRRHDHRDRSRVPWSIWGMDHGGWLACVSTGHHQPKTTNNPRRTRLLFKENCHPTGWDKRSASPPRDIVGLLVTHERGGGTRRRWSWWVSLRSIHPTFFPKRCTRLCLKTQISWLWRSVRQCSSYGDIRTDKQPAPPKLIPDWLFEAQPCYKRFAAALRWGLLHSLPWAGEVKP